MKLSKYIVFLVLIFFCGISYAEVDGFKDMKLGMTRSECEKTQAYNGVTLFGKRRSVETYFYRTTSYEGGIVSLSYPKNTDVLGQISVDLGSFNKENHSELLSILSKKYKLTYQPTDEDYTNYEGSRGALVWYFEKCQIVVTIMPAGQWGNQENIEYVVPKVAKITYDKLQKKIARKNKKTTASDF